MVKTVTRTISIETDKGIYEASFNASNPRGFEEIQKAINTELADRQFAVALASKDKDAAALFFLAKQSEHAQAYINAIHTALGDEEFAKMEWVLLNAEISALPQVASAILEEYSRYFKEKLKEGFEL